MKQLVLLLFAALCVAQPPSALPSSAPTFAPSSAPSGRPSSLPSGRPTSAPSGRPTSLPSGRPTSAPSGRPTSEPSSRPTSIPTIDYNAVVLSTATVYAEEGGRTSYTVRLSTEPAATVLVAITSDNAGLATIDTTVPLNFSRSNYNVEQTVWLTAVENAVDSDQVSSDVILSHNTTSDDPWYKWPVTFLPSTTVRFRIYDDESCTVNCSAGEYFGGRCNDTHVCLPCPAGQWCLGACAPPIACPTGRAGLLAGASSVADCTNCSTGSFASTEGSTTCSPCPAGYECDAPNTVDPVLCGAGTYSRLGATTCTTCPRGFFTTLTGQTSCEAIPAGFAASDPAMEPEPCSPASYSLGQQTNCTSCPAGFACTSRSSVPLACDRGSYGLDNWGFCLNCPKGMQCPSTSAPPETCAPGTAALAGATACEACETGRYADEAGLDFCLLCPRGYSCAANVSAAPVICQNGTFSGLGDATCMPCAAGSTSGLGATECTLSPPGYYVAEAGLPPKRCGTGTIAAAGSTDCTQCPAGTQSAGESTRCVGCTRGFSCGDPTLGPQPCPDGSYSLGGNVTNCTVVPRGYFGMGVSVAPKLCPRGSTSAAGATTCDPCAAGYRCPSPELDAIACGSGSYSLNSSTRCTACPPGSACPTTDAEPIACPPGSYALSRSTDCSACPPGYACASKTEEAQPCPMGSYALGNATACTWCEAGYSCRTRNAAPERCPSATYSVAASTECKTCPLGFMVLQNRTACEICPVGAYCPRVDRELSIPCPEGSYSLGGQHFCTACPPGYRCPSTTSSAKVPCDLGTFSEGGLAACRACPQGFSCPFTDGSDIVPCGVGSSSKLGEPYCQLSPAGAYVLAPADDPIACAPGYWSSPGSGNCSWCDPGHYCPTSASPPVPCGVGTYSSVGGSTFCRACSPGYNCPEASTSPAPAGAECPAGAWCNPASVVTYCPLGTYGNVTAARDFEEACALCEPGYVCGLLGTTFASRTPAPMGFYAPQGTSVPEACPAGRYNDQVGATSIAACKKCQATSYCQAGSTSATPELAVPGYFSPVGASSYDDHPCPAGRWSDQSGLADASLCRECLPGAYCTEASTTPTFCDAGTYQPRSGAKSSADCISCDAGWACSTPGQWFVSERCAAGSYCPAGTTYPNQFSCASGRYSDFTNLTAADECLVCPAGYTCPTAGLTSKTISACTVGDYCPEQSTSATSCPPGRWSNRTNLQSASDCSLAPAGYYAPGGGRRAFSCSAGYYCPVGSSSATEESCPAGRYSSETNLYAAEQCTITPAGSYSEVAATEALACPAGRFAPHNGTRDAGPAFCDEHPSPCSEGSSSCLQCFGGYACAEGAVEAVACGLGYYSAPGASDCALCPRGHWCGSNTTNMSSMVLGGLLAGPCVNGTLCGEGMTREPDLYRDPCPAGAWCDTGAEYPTPCAAGRVNQFLGAGDIDDCTITPKGYYTVEGASNYTGLCSPGYFCPAGSTTPDDTPCPNTTYNPFYGRGDLADCSLCVAGGLCSSSVTYIIFFF